MKSMKEHRMEDINGSRPNAAPKPKKRPNRFVRFLAFLVTLALMVGAVALVANYDKLNFDFIKRWFSYRTLARNDSGQAESFHFVGDSSNAFAVVDGDLLVCSPNTIRLYSGSGQAFVDQAVSMTNPVVSTAGGTALVYDAGGRELFVYSGREEVFSLTQEDGQALLSADAPDNKSVALLTIGLTDGNFESRVDLYRLDRTEEETEPDWTCPVGNNAILDLRWTSSGIWALGESGLYIVSGDGVLSGSYDYGGRYLKAFSLDGDGTASLLLGKYRAGSTAELLTINASGELAAALPVEEQVLSLSAAGRYVGVLTADRLDIYSQDLELYNTLNGTQNAQKVLQRSDGSAMLIDSTTARLYVPQ